MFTNVLYVSRSIFFPFKRTIEQKFVLVFRRLHAFVANLSTFAIPLLQIVLHTSYAFGIRSKIRRVCYRESPLLATLKSRNYLLQFQSGLNLCTFNRIDVYDIFQASS